MEMYRLLLIWGMGFISCWILFMLQQLDGTPTWAIPDPLNYIKSLGNFFALWIFISQLLCIHELVKKTGQLNITVGIGIIGIMILFSAQIGLSYIIFKLWSRLVTPIDWVVLPTILLMTALAMNSFVLFIIVITEELLRMMERIFSYI